MIIRDRQSKELPNHLLEIPDLPSKDWKDAQNQSVKQSLIPVTTWLGFLFVFFSIWFYFLLNTEIRIWISAVTGVTALILFGVLYFLHTHDIRLEMAPLVTALLVGITLLDCLALVFFTGDISKSIYMMFIFLGISLFVVDNRWFLFLIGLTIIFWGLSFAVAPYLKFPSDTLLVLFISVGLAFVFRYYHANSLRKLINSEYHERFRKGQLEGMIAEIKKNQEQLLLISTALEAAANGIAITDRDARFLWVNPAFTKITGYTAEEAIGKKPSILKSGLEDDSFYKNMWETILAGKVWSGNIVNRRKNGTLYHEEQIITPLTDEKGEISHFIGIKQDVSARVQAQEELERYNQELIQLNQAISTITSSLNLAEVEQNIVETVKQVLPHVHGATLQLMDEQGNPITKTVSQDIPNLPPEIVFQPGVGATGIAIQQQSLVNIGDVDNDPRFLKGRTPPPFKSLMSIPIIYKDRIFGALSVEGKIIDAFGAREERLLKLLTDYAAAAIQNARYSEHLEEIIEKRTLELKSAQEKLFQQQQIEQEIRLAADVQESLLPHHMPELPGFSIAAIAIPARSVSGDFYDFVNNDQEVTLVLADIAGKGIPAAMLTTTARSLVRISSEQERSPAVALCQVNSRLFDDLTHAEMFITMLLAQMNLSDGTIKYANAGHTEALWWHCHDQSCLTIPVTGIPLGIQEEVEVSEIEIVTRPGDVLLFYSDGITEAMNSEERLFGVERLRLLLHENSENEPIQLLHKIIDSVTDFCQGLPYSDDITLIVLKALPRHVPFIFPARLDQLDSISSLVRGNANVFGTAFAYQIELGVSEIITNIIVHGYSKYEGDLRGEISVDRDRFIIDFYDDGITFNPSEVPEVDLDRPHEKGYGLLIASQIFDRVDYNPATDLGNHWHLEKVFRDEK